MNKLYRNEYLFSELYLEEITNFVEKPEVTTSLQTLKEYKDFADKTDLNNWKTSFVQKVFGVLGFNYSSENENLIKLFKHGDRDNTITVCYTLLPVNDLDNAAIGKHWAEKIIRSLNDNNLDWGILTNGHKWRIYHGNEPNPNETYLEIDLENILDNTDTKNFMIFYEFMKADNFVKNEENKCSFDQFKKESFDKIAYIEDELKNALRQREGEGGKGVLNDLCMGYIEYLRSQGSTDFSEQSFRDDIYSSAMLYMFRLLFIFYSTARQLLNNEETEKFYNILNKSKSLLDSQSASHDSNELWLELRELFAIIEVHYNGGLFDPEEHSFIENTRISDFYISRVLYNMNFYKDNEGNERIISYRDMGVRHLGTLYEGLLEHRLFIASENTQVKLKKDEVKFIPESEGGTIVEGSYIPKGEVYFAGDKGERKSTGSYYTPEYIVDYIVTNTVGEKLKELKEEFINNNQALFDDIKTAIDEGEKKRLTTYLEEQLLEFTKNKILKLSVLDPAMGSGHFLVNATNRIANFITAFLNEYELQSELSSSTTYWRRRVVENCIYGVDINPLAVELSKLSLWILSMAKDTHLSFLNHHLKCGNSLISARLNDIGVYPQNELRIKRGEYSLWYNDENFKGTVENVINDYLSIEERETIKRKDVEYKKEVLDEINEKLKPYKKICDFHTAIYFNNKDDENQYFSKIRNPNKIINEANNYFHWELEFPDIFISSSGFDCIVGNPPYDVLASREIGRNIEKEREYFNQFENYKPATGGKINLYKLFIARAILLLSYNGKHSYIVPIAFLGDKQSFNLREAYLEEGIRIIEAFPDKDNSKDRIFEEAKLATCIYVFYRKGRDISINVHIGKSMNLTKSKVQLKVSNIKEVDPINYSIPIADERLTNLFVNLINNQAFERLGERFNVLQGEVNLTTNVNFLSDYRNEDSNIVLRGSHLIPFLCRKRASQGEMKYINTRKFLSSKKESSKAYDFYSMRIGLQRGAALNNYRRLIPSPIFANNHCADSINYIKNENSNSLYSVLGLLSSNLLDSLFTIYSTNNTINSYEIENLPIPKSKMLINEALEILGKYLVIKFSCIELKIMRQEDEIIKLYELLNMAVYEYYLFNTDDLSNVIMDSLGNVDLSDELPCLSNTQMNWAELTDLYFSMYKALDNNIRHLSRQKNNIINEKYQLVETSSIYNLVENSHNNWVKRFIKNTYHDKNI